MMIYAVAALCCISVVELVIIAYLVRLHSRNTELYFRMLSDKEGMKVMPEEEDTRKPAAVPNNMMRKQVEAMERHNMPQRK